MQPQERPSAEVCRILALKRDGKTDQEIALMLYYTLDVVRKYLYALREPLGAKNNAEMIQVALDQGWIVDPILAKPFKRALTAREEDIILGVEQGLTNAKIAKKLYLTENTVKTHLKRIFDVTHSTTRTQLVAVFIASLK